MLPHFSFNRLPFCLVWFAAHTLTSFGHSSNKMAIVAVAVVVVILLVAFPKPIQQGLGLGAGNGDGRVGLRERRQCYDNVGARHALDFSVEMI